MDGLDWGENEMETTISRRIEAFLTRQPSAGTACAIQSPSNRRNIK